MRQDAQAQVRGIGDTEWSRKCGHLCGLRDKPLRDNAPATFCKWVFFDLTVKRH